MKLHVPLFILTLRSMRNSMVKPRSGRGKKLDMIGKATAGTEYQDLFNYHITAPSPVMKGDLRARLYYQ